MEFEQDDFNEQESIFEDETTVVTPPSTESVSENKNQKTDSSVAGTFVNALFNKIESIKEDHKTKKLIKFAKKTLKDQEAILFLLQNFGCQITLSEKEITIDCEPIKIKGVALIGENGELFFDDNLIKIIEHIANTITLTNNMDNMIDEYESDGYYPVGELSQETIIYNSQIIEVMVGTMENKEGDQKKVYYYNGQEIFPD